VDVYWISRRLEFARKRVTLLFWADVIWVLATALVLVFFSSTFSKLGILLLIETAATLAIAATLVTAYLCGEPEQWGSNARQT